MAEKYCIIRSLLKGVASENDVTILFASLCGPRAYGIDDYGVYYVKFIYYNRDPYNYLTTKPPHPQTISVKDEEIELRGWNINLFFDLVGKGLYIFYEMLVSPEIYLEDEYFCKLLNHLFEDVNYYFVLMSNYEKVFANHMLHCSNVMPKGKFLKLISAFIFQKKLADSLDLMTSLNVFEISNELEIPEFIREDIKFNFYLGRNDSECNAYLSYDTIYYLQQITYSGDAEFFFESFQDVVSDAQKYFFKRVLFHEIPPKTIQTSIEIT